MAIFFKHIICTEMLWCNIEAFYVKKGPVAETQTKLGVLL